MQKCEQQIQANLRSCIEKIAGSPNIALLKQLLALKFKKTHKKTSETQEDFVLTPIMLA